MAKRSKAGKPGKKTKHIDTPIEKVSPPGLFYRPVIHLLIVVLIGFFSYSNTFHSPFQWDEMTYLEKNQIIKDLHYFMQPSKAQGFPYYSALKSRYIGFLTFALNYRMHGFGVKGYHIVNFSIHLINALLVYFLVILTLQTPYFVSESRGGVTPPLHGSRFTVHNSRLIAFFSSLLFASHPLQTEAVTYVFQRLASLVTLFYLLSIVLYIKGRLKSLSARPSALSPLLFYFLSLVFAVCAMKTKENAFTLPVVITLYEFLFFFGPIQKRLIRLIPLLLTLFIIPLTLIGIDKPAGEIIGQVQDPASLGYQAISRGDYFFTQFRVIVTYIRLLFLPVKQNFDYDYPVYHSFMTPAVITSFLFLFFIFGTSVYLIYKTRHGAAPLSPPLLRGELKGGDLTPIAAFYHLIGFGILWFFITLSIESSIIPIPMLINEYRVYLPSIGAFTAIATGMFMLAERLRNKMPQIRKIAMSAFFLIILALSGATYARNILWMQEIILWEDTAKKSPNKARPHNNLGTFYLNIGRLDESLREFQTALKLRPDYEEAHYNLGTVYLNFKRYDEALKEFQTALKLRPDHAEAHNNSGNAYFNLGRYDEALIEFQTALKLKPDYAEAHNNLGNVHFKQGRISEALKEYQVALMLKPDYVAAHNGLGSVYFRQGRMDEALKEYQIALRLKPDYTDALQNLEIVSKRIKGKEQQK